jgi:hypothetical protein
MTGSAAILEPAAEDVRKLVHYLREYEEIDEIVVLLDTEDTEQNLGFFLERYFPRRLKEFPKSRFLFAYSGHGTTQNESGYLLTTAARNFDDTFNSIPMTTLRAMFQQVVDSGYHVLALINACFRGDFLRRSFGDRHFIPKSPGAHAITAGGTKELTWHDRSVGTGSVFFEKLYAALDGRAGRDGIVTVDELIAYLKREVQLSTDQQQNPLSGDLSRNGSLGGFFFFNRLPLVESGILPPWDASKGVPYSTRFPGEAVALPSGSRTAPHQGPADVVKRMETPSTMCPDVTLASSRSAVPLSWGEECALRPKDMFKECENCPEMVVVPAGDFLMGSPQGEEGSSGDESPLHQVIVPKPFAVGRYTITFDERTACATNGGCGGHKPNDAGWGRGDRPVIYVSWDDAKAYVKWLSTKTGKTYRLLSEAE